MKILWLDTFSGASGDMLVGLLIDLGAKLEDICQQLEALPVSGYRLEADTEMRGGIRGTKFRVQLEKDQPQRNWLEIDQMLADSTLIPAVKARSRAVFKRLAIAEGAVHNVPIERVHFHEVGAVDSIVDIVAVAIALGLLAVDQIISTPLPMGSGSVQTEHGIMPLPAPATLELLKGIPVISDQRRVELVTPTGAAILAEAASFDEMPNMVVDQVGYGVGTRNLPGIPNLLRGVVGTVGSLGTLEMGPLDVDQIMLLETHIDDANPEWLGSLMDDLFAAGALDVAWQSLMMKKNRPGWKLTVVANPGDEERLSGLIMRQSSSIGVRWQRLDRFVRQRQEIIFSSPFGEVRAKRISGGNLPERMMPEFESCKAIAEQQGWTLPDTYRQVEAFLLTEMNNKKGTE